MHNHRLPRLPHPDSPRLSTGRKRGGLRNNKHRNHGNDPGAGELSVTITFVLNVEYDSNGETHFIQQTAQFRRRRVLLDGALPGMDVIILPLIQCISCTPVDGGTAIECDVGFYVVVKVVSLVQLEVFREVLP